MMTGTFNKTYRAIRPKLTYVYHHILYYAKTSKNFIIKKEGKYAIVNIDQQFKKDDRNRYFYMLCMYLDKAGFKLVIKTDWRDFSKSSKIDLKPLIFKQDYAFV